MDVLNQWTGVSAPVLAAIGAVVFLAAFVRGMTGFGAAIVLAPLLGLIMTPERAVMLNLLLGALMGPLGFLPARKLTDARQTVPFILAAIASAPAGLWLLAIVPADISRICIATIALLSFFLVLVKRPPATPSGLAPAVACGVGAGLVGSYAGIPGPAAVYYFVRDGVPAAVSRASMIVVFFWAVIGTALIAAASGRIDLKLCALSILLFPVLAVGNLVGEKLFGKVDARIWRGGILILLALAAVAAFLRTGAVGIASSF